MMVIAVKVGITNGRVSAIVEGICAKVMRL